MKARRLLIVTTSYPYGKGESFLHPELRHIAKYFDEIELVPCWFPGDFAPRSDAHPVNLDYATARWGAARNIRVLGAFAAALVQHKWIADLVRVLRHPHKFENLKELARALYRARMFESFLQNRASKGGTDIDLIYFYWMIPEALGAIAFRDKARRGLKVVSRAHGGDLYEEHRPGGYIGLRRSVLHGIDAIFCISDYGQSYLRDHFPFLAPALHTARLGVDDPGHRNVQPSDAPLSIVTCAFVVPEKRLHLIVETIDYLLRANPARKIKWTHIGDGELYDQLRATVSERLGTRAQVIFKGYLSYPQVMELYRNEQFDVFVNVSDSEGLPVSLMEASAFGIPMIATDVGGNSEIVNAHNGVLIAADPTIETIAATLMRFADRPAALAYRQMARTLWEEKFDAAVNHDRFGKALWALVK